MTTSKNKNLSELMYLIFLALVIVRQFLPSTMIETGALEQFLPMVSFVLGIFVVVRILSDWKNSWKWQDIVVAIISIGFIAVSNFYLRHDYVYEFIILVMGAKNIDYKKILKVYLGTVSVLLVLTISASLLGIVDNLVFYRNEASSHPRFAMGFLYVTYFCAHLFFAVVAWVYLRGKNITYIEIVIIALLGVFSYWLSEGRNSTICIAVLVAGLIFLKIFGSKNKTSQATDISEQGDAANTSDSTEKVKIGLFGKLTIVFMPLLSLLSIFSAFLYKNNEQSLDLFNRVLGHRPAMDALAFSRYKVTLWGQNFVQQIYGGEARTGFPTDYFYIDCSYVSVLLRMGIMAMIGILILWCMLTYKRNKVREYVQIFVLCLVAFHCFMENNILNVSYNPFFILLFATDFANSGENTEFERKSAEFFGKIKLSQRVVKNILSFLIFSVFVELISFNSESILSIFNSAVSVKNYDVTVYSEKNPENQIVSGNNFISVMVMGADKPVKAVDCSVELFGKNSEYLYNTDFNILVYSYDKDSNEYKDIVSINANTSKPSSTYISFENELNEENYYLVFLIPEGATAKIHDIYLNPPKPFNINYLRLVIIYLLIVLVYYFGVEKRNGEVDAVTVEIHKVRDEFISSGKLRTSRHSNMRAVYENKNPLYIIIKRFMDILLSGIAIVVLSPIFIVTAIAIKIEDNGPVFFVQNRAGKDLKPFKMWKFRSMYVNADEKLKELMAGNEQTGHAFKIKDDPRITKVGKFIRKYSIDELPQLFNIFLGDMSIVGPRPILVFQMEECDEYDKQRLIVQPGLTCIWQVSGRANIKWDKWIELDLDYIEQMSLLTDIKLIILTVPVVLKGEGAF